MRDAPEIEKCREVEESKNRHGQKKLKSQKVKKSKNKIRRINILPA